MRRLWPRLLIVLTVLGSAHAYIWLRFVHAPRLPAPWNVLATVAMAILAPGLPVSLIVSRRFTRVQAKPFLWVAYTWFGCAVYLLLGAMGTDVARAFGVPARTAAAYAAGAVALTFVWGLVHARRGPFVKRTRVALSKLPAAAGGYTIVQLTDVHIGWTLGADFARRVVDKVNALSPDLIVLTGDLVDGHVRELAPEIAPFGDFRAKDGVWAVTGNHEYYWNAEAWLAHLSSLGIRYLRNAHVTITGALTLAGTDDITASAMATGHGEDVARAVAGADPTLPIVLLAHHPRTLAKARTAGVDLQLSGHTHGGQLLPLGWLARLFEPHVAGLARFGSTWLYVSEGTGFWGPPLRVGTSCEIAAITLERPS